MTKNTLPFGFIFMDGAEFAKDYPVFNIDTTFLSYLEPYPHASILSDTHGHSTPIHRLVGDVMGTYSCNNLHKYIENFEYEDKFKVSWKLTDKVRLYNVGEVSKLQGKQFYKGKIGIEVTL